MNAQFFTASDKKKLLSDLKEKFGIDKLPYLFVETGKEKIRAFSGSMTKEEIIGLDSMARVELIGLYICKYDLDLRLSFDATQMLSSQIHDKIIELTETQLDDWMRGLPLDIPCAEGSWIIKYKDDFVGCAYSNGKSIYNYVPKERQVRQKRY